MDLYQKIIKNKKISEGRILKEVNAGHFVAQKRKDRVSIATAIILGTVNVLYWWERRIDLWQYTTELAPRSAIWRSNLVALSQRHNVSF